MSLNDWSTPLIVVAAALVDAQGRVLVQQRPAHKAHAGLWEFPGGKVESGERPIDALARELSEELEIIIDPAATTPAAFAEGEGMVLLLYRCTRWTGPARALEASALCWDRPAALRQLPMPPLDVPLLESLI